MRSVSRWFEKNAGVKPARLELRCVSALEGAFVLESFAPPPAKGIEAFAEMVLELAQEDCNDRGDRSEYHLVALGDDGAEGVVDDRRVLATHPIRCLPKEQVEDTTRADDVIKLLVDHQQVLMRNFVQVSQSSLHEVQRVSTLAIEATRGLVAPLTKRIGQLEEELAEAKATAREAELVIATAGADEEDSLRSERRTVALEKLAGILLRELSSKDLKAAAVINEVVGQVPEKK